MRPVLLDTFCRAGGCSMGYYRAGFDVVGVDIDPQPRYPFQFIQGDALEFIANHGHEFDAIHASPPCQANTALKHLPNHGKHHKDMIPETRAALKAAGRPYIIENVPGAPIDAILMLCGSMFGLATTCGAELRRHRYFEMDWWPLLHPVPPCNHGWSSGGIVGVFGSKPRDSAGERHKYRPRVAGVYGGKCRDRGAKDRVISVTGATAQQNTEHNKVRERFSVDEARIAMGIDWMGMKDLSQAIPPAYTEFIGRVLMEHLRDSRPANTETLASRIVEVCS